MTATIGIGDKVGEEGAKDYIINMCAKFGLQSAPSQSKITSSEISEYIKNPTDGKIHTDLGLGKFPISLNLTQRLWRQNGKNCNLGLSTIFLAVKYSDMSKFKNKFKLSK